MTMNNPVDTRYATRETQRRDGFTVVELLVATGIFATLVTIAVGVFIQALRTERILLHLMAINNNSGSAIEQIAREVRTGYRFCEASYIDPDNIGPCLAAEGNDYLKFTNYQGVQVTYQLVVDADGHGTIVRSVGGVDVPVIASDVNVLNLWFTVSQPDENRCAPWLVTLFLAFEAADPSITQQKSFMQTSLTSRVLPAEAPGTPEQIFNTCPR